MGGTNSQPASQPARLGKSSQKLKIKKGYEREKRRSKKVFYSSSTSNFLFFFLHIFSLSTVLCSFSFFSLFVLSFLLDDIWPFACLTDWLAGWLVGWLAGWLAGWQMQSLSPNIGEKYEEEEKEATEWLNHKLITQISGSTLQKSNYPAWY